MWDNNVKMLKQLLLFVLCLCIYSRIKVISANENTVFLYNHIENCKSSEYYDVNYFVCRECDPQLNLMPSKNGKLLLFFDKTTCLAVSRK